VSKGNTFENDLLKLIFNAVGIANIADNAATSPLTNLYVSLHTADVGEGGSQTTNEAAYTAYARQPVARTTGGWTVTGNSVSPVATIQFPTATGTGGSEVETHFAIGTSSSGAGKVLYKGIIGSRLGGFTGKASTDTITIPGSTLAVNDRISFYPIEGFALPTGVTEGTVYFVKTVSGADITISTTAGGTTVDLTADGVGTSFKHTPLTVAVNTAPQLTTGTTVTED
jgi:hypothetical protein